MDIKILPEARLLAGLVQRTPGREEFIFFVPFVNETLAFDQKRWRFEYAGSLSRDTLRSATQYVLNVGPAGPSGSNYRRQVTIEPVSLEEIYN